MNDKELIEDLKAYAGNSTGSVYASTELFRAAADALAARQPTENDREALAIALFEIRDEKYDDREWVELDSQERELYYCQADACIRAGFSRAAVPDAATRRVEEMHRLTMTLIETRDERDAALAAVERVRAAHQKKERHLCGAMSEVPHRHGSEREPYPIRPVTCTEVQGHDGRHRDAVCCWNFQNFDTAAAYKAEEWADRSTCSHCQAKWPRQTVAALDGAPEPEWEYGCAWDDGATSLPFADRLTAEKHLSRFPNPNGRIVRRPKAPEWLPVEGESKP